MNNEERILELLMDIMKRIDRVEESLNERIDRVEKSLNETDRPCGEITE